MTNPCLDRLRGYRPNALAGRPAKDFAAPNSRAKSRPRVTARSRTVRFFSVARYLKSDGTELVATLNSTLVERPDLQRGPINRLWMSRAIIM
jgi:hypothetical protein